MPRVRARLEGDGPTGVTIPVGHVPSLCPCGRQEIRVLLHPPRCAPSGAEITFPTTLRAPRDSHAAPRNRAVRATVRPEPLLHRPAALVTHPPLIPLAHWSLLCARCHAHPRGPIRRDKYHPIRCRLSQTYEPRTRCLPQLLRLWCSERRRSCCLLVLSCCFNYKTGCLVRPRVVHVWRERLVALLTFSEELIKQRPSASLNLLDRKSVV